MHIQLECALKEQSIVEKSILVIKENFYLNSILF
jgi:hypothetical protein